MKPVNEYLTHCHPRTLRFVEFDDALQAFVLRKSVAGTELNLAALAEINFGWDIWQVKSKKLGVLENFIQSCFSVHMDNTVHYRFMDWFDSTEGMSSEDKDLLHKVIKREM